MQFTLLSVIFGFVWGMVFSLFKISNILPRPWFAVAHTSIFRGAPLILQLTLI